MTHVQESRRLGKYGLKRGEMKCKCKVIGENCNITPSLGIVVLNDGIFFVA
jgi:hypothetical protein